MRSSILSIISIASSVAACSASPAPVSEDGNAIVNGDTVRKNSVIARSTVALTRIRTDKPECAEFQNAHRSPQTAIPPNRCLEAFCSATVVGPRELVTAAHCVASHAPRVMLGDNMARETVFRDRGTFHRIFVAYGPDVAKAELREVEWMMPRSRMPNILASSLIAEDDLDEDYFSDWSVNPLTIPRDKLRAWATARDIAVVSLTADLPVTAQAAVLPTAAPETTTRYDAAGYGLEQKQLMPDSFERPPPVGTTGKLRSASATVSAASTCETGIHSTKGGDGRAVCDGDSGGPLFKLATGAAPTLVGVASMGDCVGGSEGFGEADHVDPRRHYEWAKRAFEQLGRSVAIPDSPLQCAGLEGDIKGSPRMN